MHFLMTTDVESFSIPLNGEDSDVVKQIYEVGLPRLLDLYARSISLELCVSSCQIRLT